MAKRIKGVTSLGYPITNCLSNRYGRKFVVVKRGHDYAVGAGYDNRDGTWSQGYYGFGSREKALNFARNRAYRGW